jgi:hypothetical protein
MQSGPAHEHTHAMRSRHVPDTGGGAGRSNSAGLEAATITRIALASASGAVALAAAQNADMWITGRRASETPVRAFEILTGRFVSSQTARTAVGYAVQSFLGPTAAVAARLAGRRVAARLAAATLAPISVVGIVNPVLGSAQWPWRWTREDWTRELTLKSVLAIAVVTTL